MTSKQLPGLFCLLLPATALPCLAAYGRMGSWDARRQTLKVDFLPPRTTGFQVPAGCCSTAVYAVARKTKNKV